MNKYQIKLYNNNDNIPKSVYYIERNNVIGVAKHIKTMQSINSEFKLEYKKV
tara:strand:- start:413 stop:568 length:156 start_codon:yes stop_codon:yes gene_type:complete